MHLILWPQLGRWWGWRLLGYPPPGRSNGVGLLPGTSRSSQGVGTGAETGWLVSLWGPARVHSHTVEGRGCGWHQPAPSLSCLPLVLDLVLEFFPLLPPAPSTWSPFGPAPLLAGLVLGCCPGFWHHCKQSTADLSTLTTMTTDRAQYRL